MKIAKHTGKRGEKNPSAIRAGKTGSHKNPGKWMANGFLLPSILGVLLFFVLPFFIVIYYSVIDNPINAEFVGFDNFKMVFENAAFRQAAFNTMTFSAIAMPLAVVLSLLLAILMESKIPFKSQFRTFFLSPMMVPIASVVLIWQVLFHYNGMMNEVIGWFGKDKIDWLNSDYAQVVIIVLFLWKNLGYNMILFMSALSSIPKDILEVAVLESATPMQIFWHIKLRYLSSTILFVTIMSLINSFKVFREIYLLKGDYPYPTMYMLQHFMNNTFSKLDYQKMSAAAIMMAVVMVIIIGILFLTENYFGKDVEGELKRRDPAELFSRRLKLQEENKNTVGWIRILLGTMVAGCFAVLFLMPIILTITNSFMSSSEIAANYGQVFATTDSGGKVFISSKVNLKFIPGYGILQSVCNGSV